MALRPPHPLQTEHVPGLTRTVLAGILAVVLLVVLVTAVVSALAWSLVQGLLLLVE